MTNRRAMTIDSRLTEIPRLAQWVDEQLRGSGFADDLVFDIQVCLEEAIANIVLHSFKGEAGHPLEIQMDLGANDVRVDICDSGPPFDPREAAEPALAASLADAAIGGTGIRLIRGLSRSLDYVRLDGANRLSLTFENRFMTERTIHRTGAPPDDFAVRPPQSMPMLNLDGVDSLAIMEFVPIGAAVVGPDLTIYYINRRLRELLGLAEALSYPLDGTQLFADQRPVLDFDSLIRSWQSEGTFECELRRDNGEPLWVLTSARTIRLAGAPASIVWFQDVTASRRATIALERREERLALAVTGARLAVWEIDLITGQRWWSPEFYRMLGYSEAEAAAQTDDRLWQRHLYPEDRDWLLAKLAEYLKTPSGSYDAIYRMVRVDGSVLWVEVKGHPSHDAGGRATRLNGVSFDVTARINAEQELRQAQTELIQAEKMAALGSLVAGVAHEINTPIGNTLTAASHLFDRAQAFRARLETDKIRKTDLTSFFDMFEITARLILRDTERAIELIQSFKQVAVDQTSGERRGFDLKGYIEEVLLSLRPRIRRTKIAVEIDCPPDILMDSYPGALSQVLTNFVMNSLMHAYDPQDSGRLHIEVSQPRPGQVELVYSDDGKGMPRDVLEHIFDPFFTTKRGSGGSGLGMHIVYNIVTTTLRGTIRVESEIGGGARFIVRIPVITPSQAPRAAPKGASAQSPTELNASAENSKE